MLDSSFNSFAFQTFCAFIGIVQNGDHGPFILVNNETGEAISNDTFPSRDDAEKARREMYDNQ